MSFASAFTFPMPGLHACATATPHWFVSLDSRCVDRVSRNRVRADEQNFCKGTLGVAKLLGTAGSISRARGVGSAHWISAAGSCCHLQVKGVTASLVQLLSLAPVCSVWDEITSDRSPPAGGSVTLTV